MNASFPNVLLILDGEPYLCLSVTMRSHILDYSPCPLNVHPSQWSGPKTTGYTFDAITMNGNHVSATIDFPGHPEAGVTTFKDDSGRHILVLHCAHSA